MRCRPRYLLWALVVLLGLGSLLSACGQKGDLYLPEEKEQKKQEQSKD